MNPFNWLKNQSLFQDARALRLLLVATVVTVISVISMLAQIEPQNFRIVVRYSEYNPLGTEDEWITLYAFPVFAVVTYAFSAVLAIKIHKMRPALAQIMLGLFLITAVFTYLVSRAILREV